MAAKVGLFIVANKPSMAFVKREYGKNGQFSNKPSSYRLCYKKSMLFALLLLNLLLSAFLTGLIWFVQLVHYPIFAKVSASHFIAYQTTHMQTTGYVVAVPMLLELAASGVLLLYTSPGKMQILTVVAFALVVLIWITTFFVSVPIHNTLVTNGFQQNMITKLVATNWVRTLAWTLRTGILVYLVLKLR